MNHSISRFNQFKRRFLMTPISRLFIYLFLAGAIAVMPSRISAHCDTYAGPVIVAAKQALEKGDVTPLLKWVKKEDEEQVKAAFKKAIAVRAKGPEAKDLADQFFFETLVRLHRTSEGAPYTGLKSGPMEPIETLADKALAEGKADSLTDRMAAHLKEGVKERFMKVIETKKNADKSVEAGREYVAAYVTYLHYVLGVRSAIMAKGGHAEGEEQPGIKSGK
jgi:hypothetical protein